jgi:hypothetical protein
MSDTDSLGHRSKNGQTYGAGIYCSKYFGTASCYGTHVFVCAVVQGKIFKYYDGWTSNGGLQKGYDSHVGERDREWVVFDSSQIVPLCVVEIKLRVDDMGWEMDWWTSFCRGTGPRLKVCHDMKEGMASENFRFQKYRNDAEKQKDRVWKMR